MKVAYRMVRVADKLLNTVICLVLVTLLLFGTYALWDTWALLNQSSADDLLPYKPVAEDPAAALMRLQQINPDVCGWLTIDNTNIDYPLLIGESNEKYINTDIYGQYAAGGSLFLDHRNRRDFSDFSTIVYGHNMSHRRMFSDLKKFKQQEFFDTHQTGMLYTLDGAYALEVVSFVVTDAYDRYLFNPSYSTEDAKQNYCSYITEAALYYRDVGISTQDRFIVMATCFLEATNGRYILLARIVPHIGTA